MGKWSSKNEFVKKAITVHGNKFDYSKFEYIDWKTKSIIICSIHGDFLQSPNKHLQKRGCPACGGKIKNTTEWFINKANIIHNFKYDYSKVDYKNYKTKVEIICNLHGSFFQTPVGHIKNESGCFECYGNHKLTTDEFIKKSKLIHGNKYDYSKSIYINCKISVIITCKYHGDFEQAPIHHMTGSGCKQCNVTGGFTLSFFKKNHDRKNDESNLYLIKFSSENENFYKLGITKKNIKNRFASEIKYYSIEEIFTLKGRLYPLFCLEQKLHKYVSITQTRPIKTKLIGGTSECFYAKEQDVLELINIIKTSNEYNSSMLD